MSLNTSIVKILVFGFLVLFLSGFDYSKHSIPKDEIYDGGPGKDGIPAIMKPIFVSADEAGFLKSKDRVIGFAYKGEAKAYPVKILNWHEIVNDRVGGFPIAVTFCPLCGTGMVFDAMIKKRKMTFGVSGLLYQSDMLMYDHQTESLWSQIRAAAVTGPLTGTQLKLLSSTQTTWEQWKKKYPGSLVLSEKTGYRRDYDRDPYDGYEKSPRLIFAVDNVSAKFHPKEKIIGVEFDDTVKAYPFSELEKHQGLVNDTINEKRIIIQYDKSSATASILDENGRELPSVVGFWFAWYTFHPETKVYTNKK
ncbi:MAG: DUF3179 domain-containing protein [Nitrospinaceae bacterium]|jgi:hypothetical protein|nr:DUF3179 domain-containing protein [Nitrospinaceae bacterium]|tara:strand:- start:6219 stop:7139 length:921 start_codon:yes stop_codon:yes gene_type:complete